MSRRKCLSFSDGAAVTELSNRCIASVVSGAIQRLSCRHAPDCYRFCYQSTANDPIRPPAADALRHFLSRSPDCSTDVLTPAPIAAVHFPRMRPLPNLARRGLATMHDQRPPNAALCLAAKSPHVGINPHLIGYSCRRGHSPSGIEPSGVRYIRLSDMQFLQNVSTSAVSAGVLTQPRPKADIGPIEVPQCSRLLSAVLVVLTSQRARSM
jgi:hypothetical protein